jgi:parvulin-like peptidyl-prolyl isomerase
MKENSEDPETKDGKTYDVDTASPLPFAKLAVRLKDGEIGMIKSPFGWHVVKRLPPDPLESSDILKREPVTQKAKVKHILLGWKERHTEDPRGLKRDHAAVAKLVNDTVARLKKGEKIEALMKELSEDPGSAKSGESYPVDPSAGLVKPFKDLSLRLNVGEVGVVETQFGFHIIQRVE